MIVVKAFENGLRCRGYQYQVGLNTCEDANCARNGFHAAEDPLDCLSYYSSFAGSEFWVCDAGGDVDEDGHDSRISCTELTIIKRLSLLEYVYTCLKYLADHPQRKRNPRVMSGKGTAQANRFVIVEGDSRTTKLMAKGGRIGDLLGFHDTATGQITVLEVDGTCIRTGVYYGPDLKEAETC